MNKSINIVLPCLLLFFLLGCDESSTTLNCSYKYIQPDYDEVKLVSTKDTLHFMLNDTTYNEIESMNYFVDKDSEYLSFYDQRSASVLVYKSLESTFIYRFSLRHFLKNRKLYKTRVYIKNFDSIFITNNNKIYLFDSSGKKSASTAFLDTPPDALASLENDAPPIVRSGKLYTAVRPSILNESLKMYKKWKVIYEFDLKKDSIKFWYNLPDIYHKNLYGYQFLHNSFCYNDKNHFVFSFSADTNIYETNLEDYHIAYNGRSIFQKESIKWKKGTSDNDEGKVNYSTSQAYGAIYFDPVKRRYLRVAKKKIPEEEYNAGMKNREQSMIVFDDSFKIIGESVIDRNINLSTIFFTKSGKMYARVNAKDENALHFVGLAYDEKNDKSTTLAQFNPPVSMNK